MAAGKTATGIRRRQIVEAALGIVSEKGVRGLSVKGIAERIGVVPSCLYRHFKCKGEVIEAVIAHIGERLAWNAAEARRRKTDAAGRIEAVVGMHASMISESRAFPLLLFSEEVFHGHAKARGMLREALGRYFREIAEIVAEGQRRGEIRRDVPAERIPPLLMGLVVPAAILHYLSGGAFDAKAQVRVHLKLLRGMLRSAGENQKKDPRR